MVPRLQKDLQNEAACGLGTYFLFYFGQTLISCDATWFWVDVHVLGLSRGSKKTIKNNRSANVSQTNTLKQHVFSNKRQKLSPNATKMATRILPQSAPDRYFFRLCPFQDPRVAQRRPKPPWDQQLCQNA